MLTEKASEETERKSEARNMEAADTERGSRISKSLWTYHCTAEHFCHLHYPPASNWETVWNKEMEFMQQRKPHNNNLTLINTRRIIN